MVKVMTAEGRQLWLDIADRLARLHQLVYGPQGPLSHLSERPAKPTCLEAALAIRKKCEPGWHLTSQGWLAATANDALQSLVRVVDEGAGHFEEAEVGRESVEMIERLQADVAAASGK